MSLKFKALKLHSIHTKYIYSFLYLLQSYFLVVYSLFPFPLIFSRTCKFIEALIHYFIDYCSISNHFLQYTDDLDDIFKEYRSPEGAPVEFRIPEVTSVAVVNLPIPVEARYIRLVIQDFIKAPCLRLELSGCLRQSCNDINECAENNGGCDQKCINR